MTPSAAQTFTRQTSDTLLKFINFYIVATGHAPTTSDIATKFDTSNTQAGRWLKYLEDDGLVILSRKTTPKRGEMLDAPRTKLTRKGLELVDRLAEERRWLFRATEGEIFRRGVLARFAVTPDRVVQIARGRILSDHGFHPGDLEGRPLHEMAEHIAGVVPALSAALEHEETFTSMKIDERSYPLQAMPLVERGHLVAGIAVAFMKSLDTK